MSNWVHFTWKTAYLPRRARCARRGRCDGLANLLRSVWTAWPPLDLNPVSGACQPVRFAGILAGPGRLSQFPKFIIEVCHMLNIGFS